MGRVSLPINNAMYYLHGQKGIYLARTYYVQPYISFLGKKYIPTNNKVRVYFLTHVKYIQHQVTVVRPNTLKFCNLRYRQTAFLFLKKNYIS